MTFRVGQKVVCVDDSATHTDGSRALIKGAIYTISWCGMYYHPLIRILCVRDDQIDGPFLGVQLKEIGFRRDDHSLFNGLPFRAARFRPLIERKNQTDISFALDILDYETKRAKEPERA
jgi:hypothetical protein